MVQSNKRPVWLIVRYYYINSFHFKGSTVLGKRPRGRFIIISLVRKFCCESEWAEYICICGTETWYDSIRIIADSKQSCLVKALNACGLDTDVL